MNFCNPDKIPEYDSFIELYGSAINRLWTILENITVEISGSTNPKEFLRELSFDLEIDLNILLNSPY